MSNVWTLLITDDCQEDREVYREYLSRDPDQSYQFIEAGSAEVGLALCRKQHCDAILLDFRLPDMTGLEFLDELQQQIADPLPVIMLTGQGDEQIAVQAIKRGAQDYLVKQNLEPDILQLTVRNAIHQSRLQIQLDQPLGPSRRRRHLAAEVVLHLHRSLNLEDILHTAVTEVQHILECDRVVVYQLISDSLQGLTSLQGSTHAPTASTLTKRYETGLSGLTRDPIQKFIAAFSAAFNDKALSQLNAQQTGASGMGGTKILLPTHPDQETYLLAPILLPCSAGVPDQAQLWGVLVACQNSHQRQWQLDEVSFLNEFVNQLAIVVQQSEQLSQTLDALEHEKQLNALKSQLVATVSHEYRSPLAAILAAAATLRTHHEKLPDDKQRQFLQMIETKARQMTQLADDLLVLETFESGQIHFTPQPFELLQFVSDLVDEHRQTEGKNHELIFRITGNTKGFLGDRQLLRLILTNLLSNAIKYSPAGSTIDVHLVGCETHITFEVQDEGMGIPAKEQPQLFHAFSRGSNVGLIPGTGLGLAIVKACVELCGGTVALASQIDQGTQVTVHLPKRSLTDLKLELDG